MCWRREKRNDVYCQLSWASSASSLSLGLCVGVLEDRVAMDILWLNGQYLYIQFTRTNPIYVWAAMHSQRSSGWTILSTWGCNCLLRCPCRSSCGWTSWPPRQSGRSILAWLTSSAWLQSASRAATLRHASHGTIAVCTAPRCVRTGRTLLWRAGTWGRCWRNQGPFGQLSGWTWTLYRRRVPSGSCPRCQRCSTEDSWRLVLSAPGSIVWRLGWVSRSARTGLPGAGRLRDTIVAPSSLRIIWDWRWGICGHSGNGTCLRHSQGYLADDSGSRVIRCLSKIAHSATGQRWELGTWVKPCHLRQSIHKWVDFLLW